MISFLLSLSNLSFGILFSVVVFLFLLRIPLGLVLYRHESGKTEAPAPDLSGGSLMLMIYWWKTEDSQFGHWVFLLNGLLLLAIFLLVAVVIALSSSLYIAW